MIFVFDLDGTITRQESLPLIAEHFAISKEMSQLTEQAIAGSAPFAQSFRQRVEILSSCSVTAVSQLLENVACHEAIVRFIQRRSDICAIATSNLDVWIKQLVKQFHCPVFSSSALVQNDTISRITCLLQKESLVRDFQARGESVVFIGDGSNDVAAMRQADISIGCAMTHPLSADVIKSCDYIAFSETELVGKLDDIYERRFHPLRHKLSRNKA